MSTQTRFLPESDWHEDPADLEALYAYCATDVKVEREIDAALPDLPRDEVTIYTLDQRINDRGFAIDRELCEAAVVLDIDERARLNAELVELTGGLVPTGTSVEKMLRFVASRGCNIGDLKAETVRDALAGDLDPEARRALEIRRALSRSSVAKYRAVLDMACPDDRVRGCHLYHGAGTGRWAGRGFQPQNLPKPKIPKGDIGFAIEAIKGGDAELLRLLYGDLGDVLASCIRGVVVAAPGKRLLVADFNAIEARVLAWLAGERWLLEAFATGADPYVLLAGKIYNVPPAEVTEEQRALGKCAVLGLGYGMGAESFHRVCNAWGIPVDLRFAEDVVSIYRSTHITTQKFSFDLQDAAIATVDSGAPHGPWAVVGRWLTYELPSRRRLWYPYPRLEWDTTRDGRRRRSLLYRSGNAGAEKRLYAGLIVENVTQATARDLLAAALYRLEAAGYPPVLHVHDEVVVELDEGRGSIKEMGEIMSAVPKWANGLPVKAAGYESARFRK